MKSLNKDDILHIAKTKGGFFSVNRNNYSSDKLRKKLRLMAKDNKCPLKFYSSTQKELIYSL